MFFKKKKKKDGGDGRGFLNGFYVAHSPRGPQAGLPAGFPGFAAAAVGTGLGA